MARTRAGQHGVKFQAMLIEKSPLPRGMSYVLKSSVLESALSQAGIDLDVHLIHSTGAIFFDAYFWPPNANVRHERLYVRAGVVQAKESHDARLYVESTVLPDFIAWIKGIMGLPVKSPVRQKQQHFERTMLNLRFDTDASRRSA